MVPSPPSLRMAFFRYREGTGFLKEGESFFNHFAVVERIREAADNLADLAATDAATTRFNGAGPVPVKTVVLFGELFGGGDSPPIIAPKYVGKGTSAAGRGGWGVGGGRVGAAEVDEAPAERSANHIPPEVYI